MNVEDILSLANSVKEITTFVEKITPELKELGEAVDTLAEPLIMHLVDLRIKMVNRYMNKGIGYHEAVLLTLDSWQVLARDPMNRLTTGGSKVK